MWVLLSLEISLTTYSHVKSYIVKVYVGQRREVYNLHSSLLCQKCPYFEKCLKSSCKEAINLEVGFEEESVEAFNQFVLWVYNQPLTVVHDIDVALTYILADKFLDENFKNAVVDQAKVAIGLQVMSGGGLIELYKSGLSERPLTKLYWEQLCIWGDE